MKLKIHYIPKGTTKPACGQHIYDESMYFGHESLVNLTCKKCIVKWMKNGSHRLRK